MKFTTVRGLSQSITYGKTICLKVTKKSNSFFKKKNILHVIFQNICKKRKEYNELPWTYYSTSKAFTP